MPDTDTDTDRIARAIEKRRSGEHLPCQSEHRIKRLEERADESEQRADETDEDVAKVKERLHDGEKIFIAVKHDITGLTAAVNGLRSIVAWVGSAIGLGLLGTSGTALVYVIGLMAKAPPVTP